MLILKQQRDDLYNKYLKYKDCYGKVKAENEKIRKEFVARETQLVKKLDSYKAILNNHEEIKQNLDKTSSEIVYLKNQVSQYATSLQSTVENEKNYNPEITKKIDLTTSEKIKTMENYLFKMTKENDGLRQKIDSFVANTGLMPNNNIINNYINKINEDRLGAFQTTNNNHTSRLSSSQLNTDKQIKRELTPDVRRIVKNKPPPSPDATLYKTKNNVNFNNKTLVKVLKKDKSLGKLKTGIINNNLKVSSLKTAEKNTKNK